MSSCQSKLDTINVQIYGDKKLEFTRCDRRCYDCKGTIKTAFDILQKNSTRLSEDYAFVCNVLNVFDPKDRNCQTWKSAVVFAKQFPSQKERDNICAGLEGCESTMRPAACRMFHHELNDWEAQKPTPRMLELSALLPDFHLNDILKFLLPENKPGELDRLITTLRSVKSEELTQVFLTVEDILEAYPSVKKDGSDASLVLSTVARASEQTRTAIRLQFPGRARAEESPYTVATHLAEAVTAYNSGDKDHVLEPKLKECDSAGHFRTCHCILAQIPPADRAPAVQKAVKDISKEVGRRLLSALKHIPSIDRKNFVLACKNTENSILSESIHYLIPLSQRNDELSKAVDFFTKIYQINENLEQEFDQFIETIKGIPENQRACAFIKAHSLFQASSCNNQCSPSNSTLCRLLRNIWEWDVQELVQISNWENSVDVRVLHVLLNLDAKDTNEESVKKVAGYCSSGNHSDGFYFTERLRGLNSKTKVLVLNEIALFIPTIRNFHENPGLVSYVVTLFAQVPSSNQTSETFRFLARLLPVDLGHMNANMIELFNTAPKDLLVELITFFIQNKTLSNNPVGIKRVFKIMGSLLTAKDVNEKMVNICIKMQNFLNAGNFNTNFQLVVRDMTNIPIELRARVLEEEAHLFDANYAYIGNLCERLREHAELCAYNSAEENE